MKEKEVELRLGNDNVSSLYKVVLECANIRTQRQFFEDNSEFEQIENEQFFLEKQRFMQELLIERSKLKSSFLDFVGREAYEYELNYFTNCNEKLQRV